MKLPRDCDKLPPEPYRKAFIKEYARLLEIKLSAPPPSQSRSTIRTAAETIEQTARKVTREAADLTKDVVESTKKTTETVKQKFGEGVKDLTAKELWDEAEQVRNERLGKKEEQEPPPGFSVRKREPTIPEQEVAAMRSRRYSEPEPDTYENEEGDYKQKPAASGMSTSTKIIIGLLLVGAVIFGYSLLSKRTPTVVSDSTNVTDAIPAPQIKPEPKEEVKQDTVQDTVQTVTATPVISDSLVFTVRASDSVWVSITPDRKIGGYRGKLYPGETKTFVANDKYLVFIGNLKALTMTMNGQPVESLPTVAGSEMVVRNVVLTKDKAYIASAEGKIFDAPKVDTERPHSSADRPSTTSRNVKPVPPARKPESKKRSSSTIQKPIPSVPPTLPQPN
jgi:hypothetical protein